MTMKTICLVLFGFIGSAFGQNDIIIPVLYMPFVNIQAYNFWLGQRAPELSRKFTAIHLVVKEPQNYNIEKLYRQKISTVADYVQPHYTMAPSPPPPSSISDVDYYWSTNISRDDIKGTALEGIDLIYFTFGNVQEMMLKNISKKMSIKLSQVAVRLGVPTRNLSYAYDPATWDVLVHAMVAEGILSYKNLLQLGSEDKVAALVSLTLIQLKNVTIDGFLSLLPPFLPKKRLLDQNKTSHILVSTGLSAGSTVAPLYKMVNLTTRLTVEQFGILYNLTTDQQRATERSTLLQISQACDISMSLLLDKSIPNVVWDALGNIASPAPCSVMLKVKGRPTSSFGFTNPQQMTVLQILLGICNQYWKSCRLTMTLEPSEWECLDSVSLSQAATILLTTESSLLDSPVHDLVSAMLGKCKNRSHDLLPYRQNTSNALQTLFNLTASQLQTLLGITPQTYASFNSAQMVEAFLNGSSIDLGIPLSTMFNTSTKTIQELYSSPFSELQEIIPFILRSAIKLPASQLRMSYADTFILLGLFPDNSTIAELKSALKLIRIRPLSSCREIMEKETVLTKVLSKGICVSCMGKQNVLQFLMLMCNNVSISNMSLVMGWSPENTTVLGNYTMEDAALCKRMPVKDVVSRTLMALVEMVLNEVHGCVIIPCRSGTVFDYQTYTCTDINECSVSGGAKCKDDQICRNYFGGYECECVKQGTSLDGKLCIKTKHYLIKITLVSLIFTANLKSARSLEFYKLKEKLQNDISQAFKKSTDFKDLYKSCRVRSFSSGSVVANVSVYTSPQFKGTLADLEAYFNNGLNNTNGKTYLGDLEIKSDAVKVSDFDECSNDAHDCREESSCINKEGTFSCRYKNGENAVTCNVMPYVIPLVLIDIFLLL